MQSKCECFSSYSLSGQKGDLLESFRKMYVSDPNEFGKEMAADHQLNMMQKGKVMAAFKKLPK